MLIRVELVRSQNLAQGVVFRNLQRVDDAAFRLDLLSFEAVYGKNHTLRGIANITLQKRLVLYGSYRHAWYLYPFLRFITTVLIRLNPCQQRLPLLLIATIA